MNKILIELKRSDLQDNQNYYHEVRSTDNIGYRNPEDLCKADVKTYKFHNRVTTDNKILKQNDHVRINNLIKSGYIVVNEFYLNGMVRLRKETLYCMTNETLDIISDLFIEDKQKYESSIYQLERDKKAIGQSFNEFVEMIDTAGIFKRLKYLFTGRIK